jgi:hypothetical protein
MLASRTMAVVAIIWTALALIVSSMATFPTPVRAGINAPLVVLLPGLVWLSLLRPAGLDPATRLVVSVACSLMLVMVVGLGLNWTEWGLSAPSWAVSLGLLTLLPALIRLRGEDSPFAAPRIRPRSLLPIVPWSLAVIGVVLAYDLATLSAAAQRDDGFTQLWLIDEGTGCTGNLRVGIASYERAPTGFRLSLTVDRHQATDLFSSTLEPGQRWETSIAPALASASVIEARLMRDDRPEIPYRWTRLDCTSSTANMEGHRP